MKSCAAEPQPNILQEAHAESRSETRKRWLIDQALISYDTLLRASVSPREKCPGRILRATHRKVANANYRS